MSNSSFKFSLGDKVLLPDENINGVVIEVNEAGKPIKVISGNKVINIIDQVVVHVDIFIKIWSLIKSLFKSKK